MALTEYLEMTVYSTVITGSLQKGLGVPVCKTDQNPPHTDPSPSLAALYHRSSIQAIQWGLEVGPVVAMAI